MTGNYKNVSGAELARYDDSTEDVEPVEQMHLRVDEMYFESGGGDLVITLEQRDGDSYFNISVPVKANGRWNGFANSLPRWNDAD